MHADRNYVEFFFLLLALFAPCSQVAVGGVRRLAEQVGGRGENYRRPLPFVRRAASKILLLPIPPSPPSSPRYPSLLPCPVGQPRAHQAGAPIIGAVIYIPANDELVSEGASSAGGRAAAAEHAEGSGRGGGRAGAVATLYSG